ncbi:hypothetical protein [Chitinophaga rhizosphaerae]|uniref:hypothetical protein n=1 Tax=Chitinophaga rhizosphaerae TaxID=1864947 RepID=UPI000F80D4A7|nr:hypothetical protein [Chitinophaga rhizosphaerae]
MQKLFTASLLYIFTAVPLYAQQESDRNIGVTKVIPVSPNAASIGRFGDIPVSYQTGLPNISIPFANFGTNDLKSAVSLSYHAAGLKVSEVPSWTGGGWTLNAGGAISRTVRGLPDELGHGIMTQTMKLKFRQEHRDDPAYKIEIRRLLTDAGKGQYDTEPDIFHFNFGDQSGKFYYNQETGKFHTITKSNLVITYSYNTGFIITAENGNKYQFQVEERTHTRTYCNVGGPDNPDYTVSSWYLSRIDNKTATDDVTFEYNNNAYSTFRTPNSATIYQRTTSTGTYFGQVQLPQDQECYSEVTITSQKLSKISFKEGYILFVANLNRCDLIGEKALEKMELYDNTGSLKKRFVFNYGYFGGPGLPAICNDMVEAEKVKLKLKSIVEETVQGGVAVQLKPYVFDYEKEFESFPTLRSYAQDYWGYYNGANTNGSLMPAMLWGGTIVTNSGANRMPDTSATIYGALKRITWPTGGYTDFIFENNTVHGSYGLPQRNYEGAHVIGDQVGAQTYYEDEFVVNMPAGGTVASFSYDAIGCVVDYQDYYDYPGLRCADLRIIGLTPGTVSLDVSPNYAAGTQGTIYLPNGTYKLMANFIQQGTDFKYFVFDISYEVLPTTPPPKNYAAAGLRIKKMIDYDGISHERDRIRNFTYERPTGGSSGTFIAPWSNSFQNDFKFVYYSHQIDNLGHKTWANYEVDYIRRTTSGNYPLLTSAGSYIAYKYVTVTEGGIGENGKTEYTYSFNVDDVINDFPFPYIHRDWMRGNPEMETVSKKSGTAWETVRSTSNEYLYSSVLNIPENSPQLGLKTGFAQTTNFDSQSEFESYLGLDAIAELEVPVTTPYYTITGYALNEYSVSKDFSGPSYLEKIATTEYNEGNLMPKYINTDASSGEGIITTMTYPNDYPTAQQPLWMQQMVQKNLVTVPIEKLFLRYKNDKYYVAGGVITTYKANVVAADEIFVMELKTPVEFDAFTQSSVSGGVLLKDSRYKKRMSFLEYDLTGNIIRQQKSDDVELSYLWDASNSYPIAEMTGSLRKDLFHTSFESNLEGNSVLNDSKTGRRSKTGGFSKALSNLTNGKYTLSYWQKSGANWILLSQEVTVAAGTYTINLTGQVDEVRFYPSQAMLTTYTFDPLVGMTSQCDSRNMITYYDYDGFGRLKTIRDMDNKILKQFDYQYQVATP